MLRENRHPQDFRGRLNEAFDVMDFNNSGTISLTELGTVMGLLEFKNDRRSVYKVAQYLGAKNNEITRRAFVNALIPPELQDSTSKPRRSRRYVYRRDTRRRVCESAAPMLIRGRWGP